MKGALLYYQLLALSNLFSILPLRVIYIFSDIAYFFVYIVFGYRKRVVYINLSNSFPEKYPQELRMIEKKFYRFFCDTFFENLIIPSISIRKLRKRFVFKNPEILEPYFKMNQSVILVLSHYGNWEMAIEMPRLIKHEVFATYKPLVNKGMDRFFIKSRERLGIKAVPMKDMVKRYMGNIKNGIPTLAYMLSDQRPDRENVRYWTMFLNQETPVLLGPEKLSLKLGLPVFFFDMKRTRRGYYEVEYKLLVDKPGATNEFDITERHVRALEDMIRRDPTIWLWSHRRWKHRRMIDFLQLTNHDFNSPGVKFSDSIKERYKNFIK